MKILTLGTNITTQRWYIIFGPMNFILFVRERLDIRTNLKYKFVDHLILVLDMHELHQSSQCIYSCNSKITARSTTKKYVLALWHPIRVRLIRDRPKLENKSVGNVIGH